MSISHFIRAISHIVPKIVEPEVRNFKHFEDSIHLKKEVTMRKISMVALYYLKATRQSGIKARFDVVAITLGTDDPNIEIIKNAFELAYT